MIEPHGSCEFQHTRSQDVTYIPPFECDKIFKDVIEQTTEKIRINKQTYSVQWEGWELQTAWLALFIKQWGLNLPYAKSLLPVTAIEKWCPCPYLNSQDLYCILPPCSFEEGEWESSMPETATAGISLTWSRLHIWHFSCIYGMGRGLSGYKEHFLEKKRFTANATSFPSRTS